MNEKMGEQNGDAFDPYKDDPLLTVEQAAEYLQVSVTTLNKQRREKRFPCVRFCGDARFRRSDLNRYANGHIHWGWR